MNGSELYERDFYAWAREQAALLRSGRLSEADIANIAEEIDTLGRSERREFVNRLAIVLLHLLKWRFQPELRGNSWIYSIREQRLRLVSHLGENPSLKGQRRYALALAYRLARLEAARETGLSDEAFPGECPWTLAQVLDADFWPDQ